MPVPLPPMKIQCPQCQKVAVFNSKSDVILGLPTCSKCGVTMRIIGEMALLDWMKYPINIIRNI